MKREHAKFDLVLDEKSTDFCAAPTEAQKHWMLRRLLLETGSDLEHLDRIVPSFVPATDRPSIDDDWKSSEAQYDPQNLIIQGQQVMQAWEEPLMRRLAQICTAGHGEVLEVGFGMGISASMIQEEGARSHTIIECNEEVIGRFEEWKKGYPDRDIRLVRGMWQDVEKELGEYDGILFDTYPLSQEEYLRNEAEGTAYTHAGEFFPLAAGRLREGGVFTYFSCEIDTLSRGHQRLLFDHFDAFTVSRVEGLVPPEGCQYWWADSMVAVAAWKGRRETWIRAA